MLRSFVVQIIYITIVVFRTIVLSFLMQGLRCGVSNGFHLHLIMCFNGLDNQARYNTWLPNQLISAYINCIVTN